MSSDIQFLSELLAIGIGPTIAVLVLLYVVKNAVATAVELAGQKELERLKSTLATDVERLRQDFARQLENERVAAARDLERFRAELTTLAETRRQLAARRFSAVQEIVALGEPLIRGVLNAAQTCEGQGQAMRSLANYGVKVRELAYLFDEGVASELYAYSNKLRDAQLRWQKNDPQAIADAGKAYDDMLMIVRQELGVFSANA